VRNTVRSRESREVVIAAMRSVRAWERASQAQAHAVTATRRVFSRDLAQGLLDDDEQVGIDWKTAGLRVG
jgi:hypothetical protein